MRFEMIGKNVRITDAMKEKIEAKLSHLEKYVLIDEDAIARVVVRVYPNSQKIEVTIPSRVGLLRSEVEQDDVYAAIDLAVDKLEAQIRKQKTQLQKKHRESLAKTFLEEAFEEEPEIEVKTKSIQATRMDLDEAIMQMELIGHNFYAYTDDETGQIAIVYRRNNGGYGLIELHEE